MPHYFFDIVNGGPHRDDIGLDCASEQEARKAAMRALPQFAGEQIPDKGDRQSFAVTVRDEQDRVVYRATLCFSGMWLNDHRDSD